MTDFKPLKAARNIWGHSSDFIISFFNKEGKSVENLHS